MIGANIYNKDNRNRLYSELKINQIPCFCCGLCCVKYQPYLTLEESRQMAHNLGITHRQFLDTYTDPRWPGTDSFLIIHRDGACVFLKNIPEKKMRLCGIHSFKPACCLDWEAGLEKSECRQGLKDVWELSVNSSGQICGEPVKLAAFEEAIQSETIYPK